MTTQSIESTKDFEATPQGQQRRWDAEIKAAEESMKDFQEKGRKVVDRFLDERRDSKSSQSRLNLFHSNVVTLRALLYGKIPKADVQRRFTDANDDVARVAGEMMERLLNTDIERDDDSYANSLRYALEDWTLPGLGVCRYRYEVEWGEPIPEQPAQVDPMTGRELAPAVPARDVKANEEVETDYVYWEDFLYSPARTWDEVRWVAFLAEMTRDEMVERFGEDLGKRIPMESKAPKEATENKVEDAWKRGKVWEIWCAENKHVYWYSEGMDQLLDMKPDPLGLDGFFPCPRPLFANASTSKLIPKADFLLAQDLYNEIDVLTSRIALLESACRVTGVYSTGEDAVGRMLTETGENKLYPSKAFAAFMEKGGVAGAISWLPLGDIQSTIATLSEKRQEKIALLYQVTGMSDIMRGQAAGSATATEQRIKAGFASTRVQTAQDELARFATDGQKIRAEIIAKHFDPETIIKRSNIALTPDAQYAQAAVALIKSNWAQYRLVVRPESIALPDLAGQKQEGVEFLTALSGFMQAAKGMPPASLPFLLEMLKWAMARFRGASTIEGVLDKAIDAATKAAAAPPQPPPPDPRMQAQQFKAKADMAQTQMDMQQATMEHQMDMQKLAAEAARDRQKMAQDLAVSNAGLGWPTGGPSTR